MADFDRSSIVNNASTIVVKIGSSVLTHPETDRIDTARIQHLAEQFAAIRQGGKRLIVVSSGAVAAGMGRLGLDARPTDLRHLQAAAATGQSHLIRLYEDSLQGFGLKVGQLLLTANDFRNRARYLNASNTIRTLFEYGVVPIVNENDTVSIDEIKFGDNDHLAAMLACMLPDSLLVILSTVDGLHAGSTNDPIVLVVDGWDESLKQHVTSDESRFGTGGMLSKLRAVRTAMTSGVDVVIANGRADSVLKQIVAAKETGTWFRSRERALPAWKQWIGHTINPGGRLLVDDGARQAILQSGRSLLAVGIREVVGDFRQGEAVSICDGSGAEFARGLINYPSHEVVRILGHRTDKIDRILGHAPYPEVVHRDNLVIVSESD